MNTLEELNIINIDIDNLKKELNEFYISYRVLRGEYSKNVLPNLQIYQKQLELLLKEKELLLIELTLNKERVEWKN